MHFQKFMICEIPGMIFSKHMALSLFWRYLQNFWTWSFTQKFDPVFFPADKGLFNWQHFLSNGNYLKNLDTCMHFEIDNV